MITLCVKTVIDRLE